MDNPTIIGLSMFLLMLLLMAWRIPISVAMFMPGALAYAIFSDTSTLLNLLKGSAVARLTVYDLSVIPLFLLMGQFATQGGLSRDLFKAASAFLGHVRGGLAMASVLSAAAFGAVCGSSVATTATITQVAYPEMKRFGYDGQLSTGTLAAGGTLGILIPPSVPLVIYAILTELSIGKLFAAAMVPGLLAAGGYLIVIAILTWLNPKLALPSNRENWSNRFVHLMKIWPILAIFIIVFGGIYGGYFSPTEGAGVGALCTFITATFNRELNLTKVQRAFIETAETSAMVFMIFLGADMFNAALALTGMPALVAQWVVGLHISPVLILLAVLVMYILLGCVMDEMSMLLLTIPVIFPAIMGLNLWDLPQEMKAIWFGILVLVTVSIGMIAPPIGMNVYVVSNLTKDVPIAETYKGILPFLMWDFVRLICLLLFPALSLTLVKLMG